MQAADPCVECGGTELKLLDGYYYCVECNTQNTNAQETVVEQKTLGDGTFAIATRRKIVKIHDSKIQMSGEWYKWHAYNFIILGLADELVAAGAKPTFKLKLLWIWTRYIKKYQNKDALGLAKGFQAESNDNLTLPSFMVEENSSSNHLPDEQEDKEVESEVAKKNIKKNTIMDGSKRDIKFLSRGVIIAMLYLALNLDESEIQLYHIFRFIKEKHLNFSNIQRFVPEDIDLKIIQDEWLKFIHSKVCTVHRVRAFAMTLLRKLDLGTPKVPKMRKIIDDFLLELCLPNDIKPMIYSLMFFHGCDFLDISSKSKEHLIQTPDYEGVAMSYILVALKMCFGLDGDYEEKLSDAVDKINDERNLSKSYRMGKYREPSTRLFSFREWCSFVQFRKVTLCKSSLQMAEQHCLDIDDYVYLEHMSDRPQNKKELQDETAMNLLSKITEEEEGRVIPKHRFSSTLTPMTDYTEIIIEHTQDQELRALLSEDFTQYSLNYACEHLELVDTNSENIIKGVSEDRKTVNKVILGTIVTKKSKTEMIYVKNCENRNWMITNPPKMEHVTCEDVQNLSNDKESDLGYDSEHPVNDKEVSRESLNVDDTDQSMMKDNRGSNDLENEGNEIVVFEINEKEVSEVNEKTVSEENEKTVSEVNEANEIKVSKVNVANEKEDAEVNENIGITDESMKEDSIILRYPESLENENETSKETEMVNDTLINATEHQANINRVSKVTENTVNSDESMKEDGRRTIYSENPVNDENVVDNGQNMDENIREINDTENPGNEKEVFEEIEKMDITDESIKEDTIILRYSESLVSENAVSKETEIENDTAVIATDNLANMNRVSKVTENTDNSDESMKEDSRRTDGSEIPVNEKEVSKETENVVDNDPNMDEDIRGINDIENPGNEKEVPVEIENIVQTTDQSVKEHKREFIITEEDEDKNIFDDLFVELDLKDEMEQNNVEDFYADNEDQQLPNKNSVFDDRASISDVTDDDSIFLPPFNPDTFDRELTIKKLILHACKKYKIPEPKEYKTPREPRKRKGNAFGDGETPREPIKRAKVNKFEAKKKVEELVSGYYRLKESDLINQMQEAVSLAIKNNQFDSLLNVNGNETANLASTEQASDALTRASSFLNNNTENQSNITLQNQSNVISQSLLEQTDKEPNQEQTDDVEQIDEHWEAKLFEGDEEMKLDDLVPKGDPKFDEEKYDVNQLYIKIKAEEEQDLFNEQDVPPKLEQILKQKIDQCKDNAQFQNLKPVPLNPVKTKFENDDSDDEIPLNVLQEEKRLLEEKVSWEDNFEPLINKENVSEFKYWFRHYDEDFMARSMDWHKKFDEELKENTPSSFYFVIRECAAILNCTTFTLYKHMQNLEKYISARAKCPD